MTSHPRAAILGALVKFQGSALPLMIVLLTARPPA